MHASNSIAGVELLSGYHVVDLLHDAAASYLLGLMLLIPLLLVGCSVGSCDGIRRC